MKSWLKNAALVGLIGLFVVASVLTAWGPVEPDGVLSEARLEDGRVVRLEAVTVGTSHVFRTGSEWWERLQKAAPRWLRGLLGPQVKSMRHTTGFDELMPWISITKVPGASADWDDLRVVADSGQVFDVNSRSYLGSFDDRRFMLPGLGVMPRRDPFFTLTGRVDRLPFTLRIANPMHTRTFPEWRTGPVPATNHVDGFDFALADARLTRTDYGEHLSVGFKAFEKGRELEDWFKYSWQLSDATGNRGYRLSTNEPAWRIELKVERQLAARWATNDYREFELAGIPKDGELREFPVVATLGGAKVARAWFAGAGEFVMENGVFTISQPLAPGRSDGWSSSSRGPSDWEIMLKRRRPWILVQRDDRSVDHLVRAFLRDARGREIRVDHRGSSGVGYFSAEVFEIRTDDEPPEGPLTLRIAGERYLRTAFTIGPARLERIDLRRSKK